MQVYLDIESLSEADIKKVGAILYCEHPSTDLLCLQFGTCAEDLMLVLPKVRTKRYDRNQGWWVCDCQSSWDLLHQYAEDPDVIFIAHNAPFEMPFWENVMVGKYGMPSIPIERWRCTMAKAHMHGLPGSLEKCASYLRLPEQKDMAGKGAMLKLSKPRRKDGYPWWIYEDAPDDFEKLYEYCRQDVITTIGVNEALRDLPQREQLIWQIDQRINQEGVQLDIDCIKIAMRLQEEHQRELVTQFQELTGLNSVKQYPKVRAWLNANGIDCRNVQAPTIDALVNRGGWNETQSAVLYCIQELSGAALSKFPAMLNHSNSDGVLRENYTYHKAHTGRFQSKGVNIANLPRPSENILLCCDAILVDDLKSLAFFFDVSRALTSSVRGMIIPRAGMKFIGGDLAQMEARTLAWLAGDERKLDKYRAGIDTYSELATIIYGYTVTKKMPERQTGKVGDLSCGFGGHIDAFVEMGKGYGLDLRPVARQLWESATPEEKECAVKAYKLHCSRTTEQPIDKACGYAASIIVQRWRAAHPEIVKFWDDLENAVAQAVITKKPVQCGRLTWFTHDRFLFCKLPSGKCVAYLYPMAKESYNGFTVSYVSAEYGRISMYGGRWAENVTQATQREILVDAMIRLEDWFPVIYHNYDECASEVPVQWECLDDYVELMKRVPNWAAGIPINVDGWEGMRYAKS